MMSDRPRFELNTVQVVASMGAAVTGAILTSYLGNGGTIVGTAVGAGATTAGFAVYKHYLARTREKVAPVIVEHARHWSPGTGSQASRGGTPTAPGTADRTVTSPYRAANSGQGTAPGYGATAGRYASAAPADQAQRWHAGDQHPQDQGDAPTRDLGRSDLERADSQTAQYGPVRMGSPGHEGNGGPGTSRDSAAAGAGNGHDGGPGKHGQASGGGIGAVLRDRPRWFVMAVTAAAVFLVALLVITLIEFGTGKPIDASVWGRKASGTTLGNVTGGNQSTSKTVTPTVSPTPTQSATPGGVGQTAPQPTSSASTAPTPSSVPSVPSVTTGPSQGAPASVAPVAPGQ
jgi:hypothetical protein